MATNLYNPNTGALLSPGQSVVNAQTGQTVTQGTTYVPYVAPTPAPTYSAPVYSAPAVSAPVTPTIINYNPNTGAQLSPGEVVLNNQTGQYVKQGTVFGTTVSAPVVTPTITPPTTTTTQPTSSYTGVSIVDYLKSIGQASDYTSRATLAAQKGITNYTGTAEQNNQLLNMLKGGGTTGGTTGGGTPPITSTITPEQQTTLDALKAQLSTAQTQLTAAQTAGVQPGQQIPASIMAGTPTTSTDSQAILDALNAAAGGTTGGNSYQQQMMDLINNLTTQNQSYTDYLKNQPTAAQQYQTYREQLGLPSAEAGLTSTNVQIQKTQGLIDQLEKDISSRISGFGGQPITEPQRRRELAVEQKPLAEQLATLGRTAGIQQTGVQSARDQLVQLLSLAGADQATQAAIAKAPLEMTQSLLPTLSQLAQYQSPEQETAQKVALEKLLKESGLGSYATTPSTSGADTITTDKGIYQWNPTTQKYDIYVGAKATTPTTPTGLTPTQQKAVDLYNNFVPQINEFIVKETTLEGQKANWSILRGRWIGQGGSASQFDSVFKEYNPNTKSSSSTTSTSMTDEEIVKFLTE